MPDEKFEPYISPDVKIPELTLKAVCLGILLAVIMGAANAYLGLYVGMTVSATIPAAVISMAIFRSLLKANLLKSVTILETNLAKTMASAGESLAAGVIFTLPALLIIGAWVEIDYVMTTVIAVIGGTLGVIFTITLRRVLIVEQDLPYPEGVACTEVLIAGEEGGKSAKYVFGALGIGMLFKLCGSFAGLRLWKEKVETVLVSGRAKIFAGSELSVALLGVGYIVGPAIASYVFLGGAIGWLVIAPAYISVHGLPAEMGLLDGYYYIWKTQIIWVGIGTIVTGGLYTLWSMRKAISGGVKESFAAKGKGASDTKIRTERDLPLKYSYIAAALMVIPIFGLYWHISGSKGIAGVSSIIMVVAAFFFTAIAGYLAGIVGSSNNPISGVTIATLLFASLLLIGLGARGGHGMAVTIGIAAVVCCSAAIAGDVMQDLKTGQLIGSTPRNLQIAEFIGVVATALIIAPVLAVLHHSYGIGSKYLPAPQAKVMGTLVQSIFMGGMNLPMFILGVEIAVLLIILNRPVMPIAVGIYLPITLSVPIFIGGMIHLFIDRVSKKTKEGVHHSKESSKEQLHSKGILFASGLIAGEALMGVTLAVLVFTGRGINIIEHPSALVGILVYTVMLLIFISIALRGACEGATRDDIYSAVKQTLRNFIGYVRGLGRRR